MATVTAERLRAVLDYTPDTGAFVWRVTLSNRSQAGTEAGCICPKSGYRLIGIDGTIYKASRLAWLYMTDDWPRDVVDHRNGVRADDRWGNLRAATHAQNLQNRSAQKNNTSGFKGVYFHPQSGRWRARISADGKATSLGLHETPELAHAAYCAAAAQLHGEYAQN
jgi:hypothetical protein